MRTRARLIEVLRSVNLSRFGTSVNAFILHNVADLLEGNPSGKWDLDRQPPVRENLRLMSLDETEFSPHIRELATEALHYLQEDANG